MPTSRDLTRDPQRQAPTLVTRPCGRIKLVENTGNFERIMEHLDHDDDAARGKSRRSGKGSAAAAGGGGSESVARADLAEQARRAWTSTRPQNRAARDHLLDKRRDDSFVQGGLSMANTDSPRFLHLCLSVTEVGLADPFEIIL